MKHPILFSLTSALLVQGLSANIILQDDFSGDTSFLNGAATDIGGVNWVAIDASEFLRNGTFEGGRGTATLAFTPVDGFVYTADTWMTGLTGNNFIGFGFTEGQSTSGTASSRFTSDTAPGGRAWMIYFGGGDPIDNLAYVDTGDGVAWSDATLRDRAGGDIGLRVVLDTTEGTGNWTATYYAKTTIAGSYTQVRGETALTNETITSVGYMLNSNNIDGTIESFSVDAVAIPEPSSYTAMAGTLSLVLIALRRRK